MSKVGPGHPPKSTRFPKGVSGNPAGRPRKERPADSTSAFGVVVDKKLTIDQNGKSREVTIEEALWHKTYQNAIAGNRSAQREVLKMVRERDAYLAARNEKKQERQVDVEYKYHGEWGSDEAMLLLEMATLEPACEEFSAACAQLLLEPWAVQAALNRRPGGSKLTEREIDEIQRCTRDAATLNWPGGTPE